MIKINNDITDEVIKHLQKNYPLKESVYVKVIAGYDTVASPDGRIGFGVYEKKTRTIYIPGELPKDEYAAITTLAHEYKHFMQHMNKERFDEQEADKFGEKIYKEMRSGKK